jgi:hypothetical protein
MNSENPQENLKTIQAKIAELEKTRDGLQAKYDNQWLPFGSTRTQLTAVEKKLAELNQKEGILQLVQVQKENTEQIVQVQKENTEQIVQVQKENT